MKKLFTLSLLLVCHALIAADSQNFPVNLGGSSGGGITNLSAAVATNTAVTLISSNDDLLINVWNGSGYTGARIKESALAASLAASFKGGGGFTNWITGWSNGANFTGFSSYTNILVGYALNDPATKAASIGFPDRNGIFWASGPRIWDWNDHASLGNELQIECGAGLALTAPAAASNPELFGFQMGGSGHFADHFRFQYDTASGNVNPGYSKLIKFITRSGSGDTLASCGIRARALNTSATSNSLCFFSPPPAVIDDTGGSLQFEIRPDYVHDNIHLANKLQTTNLLGTGSAAFTGSGSVLAHGFDICSGEFPSMVVGAESSAVTRGANTSKFFWMGGAAYDNSTPDALIGFTDSSSTTEMYLGGGTGTMRAANTIRFYAAASHNGTTGTEIMTANSSSLTVAGFVQAASGGFLTSGGELRANTTRIGVNSGMQHTWSSDATDANTGIDTGIKRSAAGVLKITDGSTGNGSLISTAVASVDGSGTDQAGTALTVSGGKSTGTGRGGALVMQTSTSATGSGSSANSYLVRNYISAKEVTLTESSATLVFNVSLAASKTVGIRIFATTRANDGTDFQSRTDSIFVSAVNKAATVTTAISTVGTGDTAAALSTGTLSTTWTAVANGNGVDIKCNAVSSLTQTTLVTQWQAEINSNDTGLAVTPQ